MLKTEADYRELTNELRAIEIEKGLYLADECVDRENVCGSYSEADGGFWTAMYSAAVDAAGFRAEDAGHDVNALLGRHIY